MNDHETAARETERDRLKDILQRKGYRESCDIPVCNCGDQWTHGGDAETRLSEIYDELYPLTNGKVALDAIKQLKAERDDAVVRGLEIARNLCAFTCLDRDLIQAEIDKRRQS